MNKPQTPEEMKAEYSKVIQENMPFGFEYYNELFEWIIAKRNEHTRQAIKYALDRTSKEPVPGRYESILKELGL